MKKKILQTIIRVWATFYLNFFLIFVVATHDLIFTNQEYLTTELHRTILI